MGFAKGLPGDEEAGVNGPSWISYPANALVFSLKHGVPLINDNPTLPVPALGGASAKDNAKLLSIVLAIESLRVALPKLRPLAPEAITEFREQTRAYVKPFRLAMLRLSKDLNAAIRADVGSDELRKAARFLAETTVYPELQELAQAMQDSTKPWYSRAVDLGRSAPELISNFFTMAPQLAVAKLLTTLASSVAGEAAVTRRSGGPWPRTDTTIC